MTEPPTRRRRLAIALVALVLAALGGLLVVRGRRGEPARAGGPPLARGRAVRPW